MKAQSKILGRWGESIVADDLVRQGFRILAANWQCRFGEIDLIATDGKYLSFTEVKLRKNDIFSSAGSAVTHSKQLKLRATAEMYLAQHPCDLQPRFDVVEVYAPDGTLTKKPLINYIYNAF